MRPAAPPTVTPEQVYCCPVWIFGAGRAPMGGENVGRGGPSPARPSLPVVMPGLVPLLSGLTSERALWRQARPSPPPCCHPGLDPGSSLSGTALARFPWTPDQVRGDNRGTRSDGVSIPQSEPRSDRCVGNPRITGPYTLSAKVKPDSNDLVPGIHVPPPPRPCPVRTAMPQDVDARNKSGHDGGGTVAGVTRARRNSHPEPADPSKTLRYRGPSPGRPALNRTDVEQVRGDSLGVVRGAGFRSTAGEKCGPRDLSAG